MMKSRNNWHMEGDINTTYFHKSVVVRRKKNKILSLNSNVGEDICDPKLLSDHIESYFQNLFTSSFLFSPECAIGLFFRLIILKLAFL